MKREKMSMVKVKCIIVIGFVYFLCFELARSAKYRKHAFAKNDNSSLAVFKITKNFTNMTDVNCARKCARVSSCKTILWNSFDKTCSTASWPVINGKVFISSFLQMFTRPYTCRFDLGYEMRAFGKVIKCVYVTITKVTQKVALNKCIGLGRGRLAKTDSIDYQKLVLRMGIDKGSLLGGHTRFWIGLDDKERENRHVWIDGKVMTYQEKSSLFNRNEPNDNNRWFGEDCTELVHFDQGRLNDQTCGYLNSYACEMLLPI